MGAQRVKLLLDNCSELFFLNVQWNMCLAAASQESDCASNTLQQKTPLLMQDLPASTILAAFLLHLGIKIALQKDACRSEEKLTQNRS